jgi:hypothetical protein
MHLEKSGNPGEACVWFRTLLVSKSKFLNFDFPTRFIIIKLSTQNVFGKNGRETSLNKRFFEKKMHSVYFRQGDKMATKNRPK